MILGLGLGLGLGGFGGELGVRVRVSKLGGELLHQRHAQVLKRVTKKPKDVTVGNCPQSAFRILPLRDITQKRTSKSTTYVGGKNKNPQYEHQMCSRTTVFNKSTHCH